ncbi:MAG TPA: rhomboid family intramembrane serine protease [Bacteroidetes bacterium]|nr:rhomboid family intramembrane serine protease [Bacteroidota bacterium]
MIPIRDDNPIRQTPYVTISIIVLNVLVFFYQIALGPRGSEAFIFRYGVIPYEITHFKEITANPAFVTPFPNILTLFTAMFLHGGFFHLFGNMLYLWIFGDNVEYVLGRGRFVIFYLLTGLCASFLHILMNPSSTVPMIGASGAISGVLGAYFLKFPRARVLVVIFFFFFIQTVYIPAVFVLGFWFLMQIMSGLSSLGVREAGGVAWFAHIGGFLAGMYLVNKMQRRKVTIWW